MQRLARKAGVIAGMAVLSLAVAAAPTAAKKPAGNGPAFKQCLDGGWRGLQTPEGQTFASEQDCVAAAKGGATLVRKSELLCLFYSGTYTPRSDFRVWTCDRVPVGSYEQHVENVNGLTAFCLDDGGAGLTDYWVLETGLATYECSRQ